MINEKVFLIEFYLHYVFGFWNYEFSQCKLHADKLEVKTLKWTVFNG